MGKLILLILCLSCTTSRAQDTGFRMSLKDSVPGDYSDFTADETGNIYLVIGKAQIKKVNAHYDSMAVYNDSRRYGRISSIDVSNPLKLLVFYKESAMVVVLDRLLGIRQVIDLRKSSIQQAGAVKLSYDNRIWVFDEVENKIKKIDETGKLLMQSDDLRNVFGEAPLFHVMFDDNRSLYLYDERTGWFVFDYYGAFIKKYPFPGWKDAQVVNGTMTGRTTDGFVIASQGGIGFKTYRSEVALQDVIKVLYRSKKMYVLYPGKLGIYDAP